MQESMQSASNNLASNIPQSIEVELTYDLVDTVCPGDDITVTGIVKAQDENIAQKRSQYDCHANTLKFYIKALTVVSNKNAAKIVRSTSDFSDQEIEKIQQLKNESNIFSLLVHSLCPKIFGHEMVKAGLVLALFGGSNSERIADGAERRNERRTESHVLVVGDPGIGKSLMLQACANVSPRGIFVCGNSTTNAGLTVSVRNEKNSDGSLEAGALVLADQGVCCIDEFDKMSANYGSLLQVMEQQKVSVAKAGVLRSLPARTCILAAANPSGGHYNKAKTVAENLKISPTLLSRFDLVFILLDRADAHLDDLLTAHIQALHSNTETKSRQSGIQSYVRTPNGSNTLTTNAPLYERLKTKKGTNLTPILPELMQKYIGYARQHCFPTLSPEAVAELKSFYLDLRKTSHGLDAIPVTTRQLEALIRLTQARARIELADLATHQHALDALAIFRYTMVDVLSSDDGTLQMTRSINGSGMSQATQNRKYLQMLQRNGKTVFSYDELKEIAEMGGFERNLTNIIESLNVQGFLIKRGQNMYKFCN